MSRTILSFLVLASTALFSVAACSGGEVPVGKSEQKLQTKKNGGATGNGQTCSWDDTVAYDALKDQETTTAAAKGPYSVGDSFTSLDGCNQCSCTAKGITCTEMSCGGGGDPGGQACTDDAKLCPDGSSVGRTGPKCEFSPCPGSGGGKACTEDAKVCDDGSVVGRTGPKCEFVCPDQIACAQDAKVCPDGTSVGRTGPKCEFICP